MNININKIKQFKNSTDYIDKIRIEEIIRLGILRDGIQLITNKIQLLIYRQVIPRIEIELYGKDFKKRVTIRIHQNSSFLFNGTKVYAMLNDKLYEVESKICFDEKRNQLGMYNFGMLLENGVRSFVLRKMNGKID